jgi:hypothetical protein
LVSALAACVDTDLGESPYRVEVLTLVGVDTATGTGRYALMPVDLPELESVSPLQDRGFRFVAEPVIDDEALGELYASAREGQPSRAADYAPRLRDVDGVGVPRDITSLQVISAYHSLREVIAAVPELTGEDASVILPDRGFEVWVHPKLDDGNVSQEMTANAFYISPFDVFGLVAIDPIEKLPVGAAQPVLAHEFGHHLFYRSFGLADGDCDPANHDEHAPGRLSVEPAIQGMNEGFGDLVSFAVTGVSNAVADVFPGKLSSERAVDVRLPNALVFRFGDNECEGDFYCIGTLFTRSLVQASVMRGEDLTVRDVRMALVRDAFHAVAEVPPVLRERFSGSCDPLSLINPNVVSAYLGTFVAHLPEASRATVCARFIENFGDLAFLPDDRGACR